MFLGRQAREASVVQEEVCSGRKWGSINSISFRCYLCVSPSDLKTILHSEHLAYLSFMEAHAKESK